MCVIAQLVIDEEGESEETVRHVGSPTLPLEDRLLGAGYDTTLCRNRGFDTILILYGYTCGRVTR